MSLTIRNLCLAVAVAVIAACSSSSDATTSSPTPSPDAGPSTTTSPDSGSSPPAPDAGPTDGSTGNQSCSAARAELVCALAPSTPNADHGAGLVLLGLAVCARRSRRLRAVLLLATLAACSRASGHERDASASPRIVSVGSAVTESVYALGAGDEVVGVDTSSFYPDAATKLPQIGYQRTLAAEGILALRPTLVLASAEAGPPAVLDQLRSAGVRLEVVAADPTVDGAKARIRKVAEVLGRDPSKVLADLDADLDRANAFVGRATQRPKVLVLYARGANTLHVFGKGTSAETMVRLAGADNVVTSFEGTKPLTPEALALAAPDVIVVPSRGLDSVGGLDALLAIPGISTTPAGKSKRIVAEDDLLLLGFGPRTGKAALELGAKLHPEIAPQ